MNILRNLFEDLFDHINRKSIPMTSESRFSDLMNFIGRVVAANITVAEKCIALEALYAAIKSDKQIPENSAIELYLTQILSKYQELEKKINEYQNSDRMNAIKNIMAIPPSKNFF